MPTTTIQDLAVIAKPIDRENPIGEASADHETHALMTQEEREDMVTRLSDSILTLMEVAHQNHPSHEKVAKAAEATTLDPNHITRLSTHEFFFYTREPLRLDEFEALQNTIMQEAEKRPLGIHLVLGSFAVRIEGQGVINVTPFIRCGKPADVDYIVKSYSSSVDVSYQDTDGVTMTRLDSRDISSIQMPELSIQGKTHTFSFMNIIPCTTPSGETLLTAVEICLDHRKGVAMSNLEEMVEADMSILGNQVSHLVISNTVSLKPSKSIGKVMHVDPQLAQTACKRDVPQKKSDLTIPFGKNKLNLYTLEPTPCETLRDSLKEQAPEEVERKFNQAYSGFLKLKAFLEKRSETSVYLDEKIALFEEAKTQMAALEALKLSSNDDIIKNYMLDFKCDFTCSYESTNDAKRILKDINDTVTALNNSSIQNQLAQYRKHDWAIPSDIKDEFERYEKRYLTNSIAIRKSPDYQLEFSRLLSMVLGFMQDHTETLFKQKINTLKTFKRGPSDSTIDELICSKTEEFKALEPKDFDEKEIYFQAFDKMLQQLTLKNALNQEVSEKAQQPKPPTP